MNKKTLSVLSVLCFSAAVGMFVVGSENSRLTELKDFFWVPIAPAIIFGLLAKKK
jgi:hypothetical protein